MQERNAPQFVTICAVEETCLTVFLPRDGCTTLHSEMNKSVTSGQATVKRDLVVASGRRGEAVCPLNALLQRQQPHANSLSLVCRRLCSGCQTACSSTLTVLEAAAPLCTLVSLAHLIAYPFVNPRTQSVLHSNSLQGYKCHILCISMQNALL